jgi:hypothetical protein
MVSSRDTSSANLDPRKKSELPGDPREVSVNKGGGQSGEENVFCQHLNTTCRVIARANASRLSAVLISLARAWRRFFVLSSQILVCVSCFITYNSWCPVRKIFLPILSFISIPLAELEAQVSVRKCYLADLIGIDVRACSMRDLLG